MVFLILKFFALMAEMENGECSSGWMWTYILDNV